MPTNNIPVSITMSLDDVHNLVDGLVPGEVEKQVLNALFVALRTELDRYDPWSHEIYLINKEIAHVARGAEKYA